MAPPLQPVDDTYQLPAHMAAQYKSDGQPPRAIPLMMPSTDAAVQYTNMLPQVRFFLMYFNLSIVSLTWVVAWNFVSI